MKVSILSTVVAALSVLAPSVHALPSWPSYGKPEPRGNTNLARLALQAPKSTLPAPTGLQLKFVGLGIGTQNYTCQVGNDTAAPGTTGALAKLYDIGSRLNTDPMSQWKLNTISGLALSLSSHPKLLDGYLMMQGYQRVLGEHFFTQTTPTFSLYKVTPLPFPVAFVTKDDVMDAPKTACPGQDGLPAIQWVKLSDKDGRSQGGVNTVYRLETAGGNKPATCKGQKAHWEVPYAAQYWVYGPKS
ncbi:hypothetical protein BDV96DRAFT_642417 [Lophiotrema nucula]|uniref:Malate dehydrogenase n=1 Tax=Lophiotrema nucula TaxID=690887 RepID=A0A6A5ZIP3_9PLEO|nr:hypothetical protein BDV96DRAFT_642417 [Lophiotrema nucula]